MSSKVMELEGWPWMPDRCPADLHFMEWINDRGVGSCVFHMGTGLHHNVGLTCADRGVACIGVTASYEEYIAAPRMHRSYICLLADIYKLDTRLLPSFSVMSLFHLGELEYMFGPIDELVLKNLIRKVDKGGLVAFYTGSSDWGKAQKVIEQFVEDKLLKLDHQYKSLDFYRMR